MLKPKDLLEHLEKVAYSDNMLEPGPGAVYVEDFARKYLGMDMSAVNRIVEGISESSSLADLRRYAQQQNEAYLANNLSSLQSKWLRNNNI